MAGEWIDSRAVPPVFTVGCEDRTVEELISLLRRHGVSVVVDIRPDPTSGRKPFHRDRLEQDLPASGIRYVYQGHRLGRPEAMGDDAAEAEFQDGIDRLQKAHRQGMRLVLLGADGRAENCLRGRRIGPLLQRTGIPVTHIDPDGVLCAQLEIMSRTAPAARPAEESDADPMLEARRLLREVFGYDSFRVLQEDVVRSVLNRRDVLAVMPTGSGKSLCYQLSALLRRGITVVISPLIALMQDHVDQLLQVGVPAVCLNSSLSYAEYSQGMELIRRGVARLVYLAPESLQRLDLLDLLQERGVDCVTIDEAHCISEWGHDFRPEYRTLRNFRTRFPRAVCLALTATATPRVQNDIRTQLGIQPEQTFVSSFDRPNLFLEVRERERGLGQLRDFLARRKGQPGIIYCSTREQVDSIAASLTELGFPALPYHAGMDDASRRENQRKFTRDDVELMVATVAFGLGINKSNVRFIIHYALPACLETYYQQVGRAGRDGLPADCMLLHSPGDIQTQLHFIRTGDEGEKAGRMERLRGMEQFSRTSSCRRAVLLPYFGDPKPAAACDNCDNCRADAAGRQQVDVSEDACLLLTCVRDTRQRFGSAYVVDVIRGSKRREVTERGHERLPCYGQGSRRSAESWRFLVTQFLEQEILQQDPEFGTLAFGPNARAVLAGAPVLVAMPIQSGGSTRAAAAEAGAPASQEASAEVLAALRTLRRELAEEENVPPYVVFSDRTLLDLALRMPRDASVLEQVYGIGRRKAEHYGSRILATLAEFAGDSTPAAPPAPARPADNPPILGPRSRQIVERFRSGLSIQRISEEESIRPETVVKHLEDARATGMTLDPDRVLAQVDLTEAEQTRALAVLRDGAPLLSTAFRALDERIPYRELRILRLYLSCGGE